MKIELTDQDVQNLQLSVLQMAKSTSTDAQAMKILMVLHDKLEKAKSPPVKASSQDFGSKDFQESAAKSHMTAMDAKTTKCGDNC